MGMSAGGGGEGAVTSEINVTPMIDVLLVLLIIFMIVNALSRTVVEVQIPPVETAAMQSSAPSTQIVLELKEDGSLAINGQTPFPMTQLDQQIHQVYDNRPAKLLFIKPSPSRVYGEVMEAIDISRGAGVQVVGFTPIEAN